MELERRLHRVLAVAKVRARAHSNALRLYTINDAGIQLGNTLPLQEGLLSGSAARRETAHEWPAQSQAR